MKLVFPAYNARDVQFASEAKLKNRKNELDISGP